MKFVHIGLGLSIGWYLGKSAIAFLNSMFATFIERSRWYQETISSQEEASNHKYANTVKNKIGFDIN